MILYSLLKLIASQLKLMIGLKYLLNNPASRQVVPLKELVHAYGPTVQTSEQV
jgi:hypothetical protein